MGLLLRTFCRIHPSGHVLRPPLPLEAGCRPPCTSGLSPAPVVHWTFVLRECEIRFVRFRRAFDSICSGVLLGESFYIRKRNIVHSGTVVRECEIRILWHRFTFLTLAEVLGFSKYVCVLISLRPCLRRQMARRGDEVVVKVREVDCLIDAGLESVHLQDISSLHIP